MLQFFTVSVYQGHTHRVSQQQQSTKGPKLWTSQAAAKCETDFGNDLQCVFQGTSLASLGDETSVLTRSQKPPPPLPLPGLLVLVALSS